LPLDFQYGIFAVCSCASIAATGTAPEKHASRSYEITVNFANASNILCTPSPVAALAPRILRRYKPSNPPRLSEAPPVSFENPR